MPEQGNKENYGRNKLQTSDLVDQYIKEQLMTKKLRPGDKVPTEQQLMFELGVSRSSVREAMNRLSAIGVIEIRRGIGTFISTTADNFIFNPILFSVILNGNDAKNLMELRVMMELGIIELAVLNATENQVNKVAECFKQMEELVEGNETQVDDITDCDLRFHMALAEATGNILVKDIYGLVMEFYRSSIRTTYVKERTGRNALKIHRNILEALQLRDVELARERVRESILEWTNLSREGE